MVKHMIIWKMKEDIADKAAKKAEIKAALEGLVGQIDGLLEMKILTEGFDCSAGDLMMDSTLTTKEALDAYQKNPLHQAVANTFVRPNMEARLSFDYEV
ncbi:MAG: Dabb family protein [Clostridia bacterium]|nr:Dabb family protein [Clostridia bacterium]